MNDIFNILDYSIIGIYIVFMLAIGILMKKYADRGTDNYFVGGKEVPWWAAGISAQYGCLGAKGATSADRFFPLCWMRGGDG